MNRQISNVQKPGKLNRWVKLLNISDGQDTYGGPVRTVGAEHNVWASKEDTSGNENYTGDQQIAFTQTVWIVRYDESLNLSKKDELHYDGNIYDILAVSELGRRMYFKITTQLRE